MFEGCNASMKFSLVAARSGAPRAPAPMLLRPPMPRAIDVTLRIPSALRELCGGARELSTSAASVREVLARLAADQPAIHRSVCDETGAVRRHIGVFVNSAHIRDLDGLDTALAPGDVVSIFTAVSGG
jgi:sulfur-carrier protein